MNKEILFVSDDAARPDVSRHNYAARLEALQQASGLQPGQVHRTAIYHDDDCAIWLGDYCDCEPVIGQPESVRRGRNDHFSQ
jgi:hypothetical protein